MFISRWFHRHGFGIQSPWAYELVTQVLCSKDNLAERLADFLDEGLRWELIDDIRHTNRGRWEIILHDPKATATFDMRHQGLVIYDPKRWKQHYSI